MLIGEHSKSKVKKEKVKSEVEVRERNDMLVL